MNAAQLARIAKNHRSVGPPTDPFWADVTSLMHFDGSQGSTTFTDQISANSWAVVGTAGGTFLDTTQIKFGSASLRLAGNAGIKSAASVLTNAATATIECFFYQAATNSNFRCIFAIDDDHGLYTQAAGMQCFTSNAELTAASYPVAQWNHVALVFNAGVATLYLNGVSQSSGSGEWLTGAMYIGDDNASELFTGWIDEFRITSGVARYTSNFTPPSAPFPNS